MYSVFFLLCLMHSLLYGTQQPVIIYPPPITIYNNTTVDQTSTTSSKQAENWSFIPEGVRSSLSQVSLTNGCDFFYENQLKVTGLTVLTTYGTAYFKTLSARNYLTQDSLWSNWRRELSTNTLLFMAENVLVKDLTFEIQQRYVNDENPTDPLSPLVRFLKKTKEEIEGIGACKNVYEWLDCLYFTRILMLDMTCFEQIDNQLQRVRYLRHIFKRWMAQQKFSSL